MEIRALTLVLGVICAGCSSTGWHTSPASVPQTRLVSAHAMDPQFSAPLIPVLETRGFTVVSTNNPDAIACRTSCGGGFGMSAEISLWCGGKMFASGKGSNAGWGCWLARGAATQDIIARAVRSLDAQLAELEAGKEMATPKPQSFPGPRK